ncbi:MAG: diacylglycerol kinase [Beijerinckiaceae bacterium]
MNPIVAAFVNSMRGFRVAMATERAVRQEVAALALGIVLTPFVATTLWQAAMLIGALLLILAIELLNTAVEKLSDHVTPERHDAIRYVKDLGSAAVFCALVIAGMVWAIALYERILG